MSELRFDGRVAVITGAGAGLGREYALLFASRGAKVVVNDLGGSTDGEGNSSRAADVVVEEIRSKGGIAVADYNSVVDGEKIIETAINNFGRIDILVNNAGILRDKSFANISDRDWDLVLDVHLKGSFKTTKAAWPIFKEQKYGRVIMTSSNSGMYGNFGQANYSTAKMALVGLSSTLAIEGERYNIHSNVIVPTAASRLTQGILPDILFNELKPKLIAPVVVYLCHETNEENGSIIESAAGWATKIHNVRGKGTILRSSLDNDNVTPEHVRDVWDKITDMTSATHMKSIQEASMSLIDVLEKLKESGSSGSSGSETGTEYEDTFSYGFKDLILYALGIGATVKNPNDLKFLYENHPEFNPIPTFFVMPGLLLSMTSGLVTNSLKHKHVELTNVLHGEQYIEVFDKLPTNGKLTTKGKVIDIMDKKSGAVVVTECETTDDSGDLIVKNQSSIFIVGAGNFNGKREPSNNVIPVQSLPKRNPDKSIQYKTSVDQAALYRLSGDLNPMHIDPNFSIIAGYKVPILHGLCSLGFSVRAVLSEYANSESNLFKAVKVRFSKTVIPGQTLKIDMWRNGNRIHFRTTIVETKDEVISGAYVDLKDVITNGAKL